MSLAPFTRRDYAHYAVLFALSVAAALLAWLLDRTRSLVRRFTCP